VGQVETPGKGTPRGGRGASRDESGFRKRKQGVSKIKKGDIMRTANTGEEEAQGSASNGGTLWGVSVAVPVPKKHRLGLRVCGVPFALM